MQPACTVPAVLHACLLHTAHLSSLACCMANGCLSHPLSLISPLIPLYLIIYHVCVFSICNKNNKTPVTYKTYIMVYFWRKFLVPRQQFTGKAGMGTVGERNIGWAGRQAMHAWQSRHCTAWHGMRHGAKLSVAFYPHCLYVAWPCLQLSLYSPLIFLYFEKACPVTKSKQAKSTQKKNGKL